MIFEPTEGRIQLGERKGTCLSLNAQKDILPSWLIVVCQWNLPTTWRQGRFIRPRYSMPHLPLVFSSKVETTAPASLVTDEYGSCLPCAFARHPIQSAKHPNLPWYWREWERFFLPNRLRPTWCLAHREFHFPWNARPNWWRIFGTNPFRPHRRHRPKEVISCLATVEFVPKVQFLHPLRAGYLREHFSTRPEHEGETNLRGYPRSRHLSWMRFSLFRLQFMKSGKKARQTRPDRSERPRWARWFHPG